MSSSRILVVGDEPHARRILRAALVAQGLEVNDARSGREAIEKLRQDPADVILLNLAVAREGVAACREIRTSSEAPIIVISANSSSKDRADALEAGADQIISRPFVIEELFASIKAARRRVDSLSPRVMLGDVEVDLEMHEVRRRDRVTHLTGKEFKLLHCLLTHRGEVMSHRRLLQAVWGPDYGDEVEYLRVFINQLRKKVEPDPANPKFIITDPSVGYRLNLEAERHSACVAERGHGGLDGAPASHQGEVRAAVITAPHILVVDDEPMLLEIIPRILQSEGFEVRSAENGDQAVEAVRRDEAIAVAILDWRLPGMSGEQVFDQLVAIRPDIRVIVASGNDLSEVGHAFSGRNVDGFLRKPFEVATLVRAVKSVFDPEPGVLPLLALSGDRRWSAENGTSNLEGSQLAAKGGI